MSAVITQYHPGGYDPALTPGLGRYLEWSETAVTEWASTGEQVSTRSLNTEESARVQTILAKRTEQQNEADLLAKAAGAIAGNTQFIGTGSPNTTTVTNQVKALSRQMNTLIRLYARLLSETTGT